MSVQATFSATLVDEWARLGVSDAVLCPGSRSTPLALSLAERLRVHVRLDERSAAFYALGLALASGRPTVVCVTSGTAAVELHPAVVEAHHARVPLIVCTADRPPELHGVGAPQTIEQEHLFGEVTRWSAAPGVPVQDRDEEWRPLAQRALTESLYGTLGPGPVHLNLAFREPLTGEAARPPAAVGAVAPREREAAPDVGEPLRGRGLLIVGGLTPEPADPGLVAELGERLGWPVFADPRSRARVPGTIGAADAIVRTGPSLPDTVVMLGAPWLSRALGAYVTEAAGAGARIVVVDPWRQWPDPLGVATEVHHCDADAWLTAAQKHGAPGEDEWITTWRSMEARAQAAVEHTIGSALNEPQVARTVYRHAADRAATIVVSASMPIRDLEWFAAPQADPPCVLANRGVNGIDGVVSTALGVAASTGSGEGSGSNGRRTIALLGDLAFLHDVSGLVNVPQVPCTLVVVDNAGGGIFSFLPQAVSVDSQRFEQLFATPPTSDVGTVAQGFGLAVHEVAALEELEAALNTAGPVVVRVRVPDRAENVALHEAINQAVRLALR